MQGTTQSQFDALVSFAFNVGLSALGKSTLLRKHLAGDTAGADCVILEATAGPLQDINGAVTEVWIYQSDTAGTVGANKQRYRPRLPGDTAQLVCANWVWMELGWPEGARDNDGADRDWVGVRVRFDHDWLTGFAWFSGSVCDRGASGNCWAADTVMHIEPDPTP